jgi:hypothetical protein
VIPLYKRAWGFATVGIATIAAGKQEAWSEYCCCLPGQIQRGHATVHCPVVPDGQSTVKLLINTQNWWIDHISAHKWLTVFYRSSAMKLPLQGRSWDLQS